MIIFHIAKESILEKNKEKEFYKDPSLEKDGFIHASTFEQILHVANNNLKNSGEKLFVLCIDTNYLSSEIKWEKNSKNGMTFPHIYGSINKSSIIKKVGLGKDESGNFIISDELFNFSKFEKSCGAIVIHDFNGVNKVLIIKFSHKGKDFFGFPKGHIEENETEIETAKREIFEETGIEADIIPGFREHTYFSCKKGTVLEAVYYYAVSKNANVRCQQGETKECIWCDLKKAAEHLSFDCDKDIFKKFLCFLKNYNL